MRRVVLVVLLGFVMVACAGSGAPESFDDQPGALPESIRQYADEMIGSDDPDRVPLVQRNFLEGCVTSDTLRFDDLSGAALARACGCSYDALVTYLIDNQATEEEAFATFGSIDDAVSEATPSDSASPISDQYLQLFAACRSQVG